MWAIYEYQLTRLHEPVLEFYHRGSRDRSPVVSLGIFSEATDGTMCPGVDSSSKYEYQENSWG